MLFVLQTRIDDSGLLHLLLSMLIITENCGILF